MKLLISILITFTLVSCGLTRNTGPDKAPYASVSLETNSDESKNIEIEKGLYDLQSKEKDDEEATKGDDIYGLIIGPGLYNATYAIGFLKFAEEKGLNIRVITGVGMGAVIASLYAKHEKASLVEWEWFKLISKLKKHKALTKRWSRILRAELVKLFQAEAFYKYNKVLLIPVVSTQVKYISTGKVLGNLLTSLSFLDISYDDKQRSSINETIFQPAYLKSLGVQKVIGVNVIGENVNVLSRDKKYAEVYSSALALQKQESFLLDQYIQFNNEARALDDINQLLGLIVRGYDISIENFN